MGHGDIVRRALSAVGVAALVLGACGGDDPEAENGAGDTAASDETASNRERSGSADSVTISDFEYQPVEVTASPGDRITYANEDGTAHTATSSDGAFDSGSIPDGGTGTITAPDEPGEYPYVCGFHAFMKGTVVVE